MTYHSSPIAPVLFREIDGMVQELMINTKQYRTRKSIRTYTNILKDLAEAMSGHRAQTIILALRKDLMEYFSQNSDGSVSSSDIYDKIEELRSMVDWSLDETDAIPSDEPPVEITYCHKLVRDKVP